MAGRSNTKTREEREQPRTYRTAWCQWRGSRGSRSAGCMLIPRRNHKIPSLATAGPSTKAMLRHAWLGGPFRQGKSSFTLQAAIHWSVGLPFLGIKPPQPLKIIIFGCESDAAIYFAFEMPTIT